MKYAFVIVVVAAAFSTVKSEEHFHIGKVKTAEDECIKEKNVSIDILTKAEAGVFTSETDNMNCFAECVFNKVGFLKPGSNELQIDVMKTAAREKGGEKFVPIVDKCSPMKGANICETTYQIFKCYHLERNKPEYQQATEKPNPDAASVPAVVPIPAAGSVLVPVSASVVAPALAPAPGAAPNNGAAPNFAPAPNSAAAPNFAPAPNYEPAALPGPGF